MISLMSFKQFFRDIRNQKMRTLMTTFGILWGTVAIILLMAFGDGIRQEQIKEMRGLGEDIAIIWGGMTSRPWQGLPRGRRVRFTEEDVAAMKSTIKSIVRISPEFTGWSVRLKTRDAVKQTRVSGVWPEFGEMRNIIPAPGGRFINALDMAEKRRVIFLGDRRARELFGTTDAVGKTVLVDNIPFTVIGVMQSKEQNSSYGGRDDRQGYIPTTTFKTIRSYRYPNNIIVQSPNPYSMEVIKDAINSYMSKKYAYDPEDTEALSIWDTTEGFRFIMNFFRAFTAFLIGIGCMTLITGGIGVTNIMNVVLEERTKEIGIKMALGAKKSVIMFQFMLETLILTAIGGALGLGLAALIIKVFPSSFEDFIGHPMINLEGAVFAVAVLGIVALVSGYFPARRAASLEPVKALKLF
ncbi:MAG: ABC transporter permease [candidate division Zixibacteria bacterium]|nr:ABC transporter permease [candidate division Zixibacteria bacterium]